jgi:fucose permease
VTVLASDTYGKVNNFNPIKKNYTTELTIITFLFFMWGFLTCLNDILIPHLKAVFSLSYAEVMLIQFCFFTAYFLVWLPSGIIVEKIGYMQGIIVGLIIAGAGCLFFYPAAGLRSFPLFLPALLILASDIKLLQVAANPYIIVLGAIGTFLYVGAEVSIGSFLVNYFGNRDIVGLSIEQAGKYVSFYWSGAILPVIQGMTADKIGIHHAFILPVICYLFIVYFGLKDHVPQFSKSVKV